jgi:hypothetical protein
MMKSKRVILDIHFINIRQLMKMRDYLDRQIIIEYKKINKIEKGRDYINKNNKDA